MNAVRAEDFDMYVVLALAVGSAAAEMFAVYSGWLKSLAAPYS